MLRIIVRTEYTGEMVHLGTALHIKHKTFDVDLPDVEEFLVATKGQSYVSRSVAGIEIIPMTLNEPQSEEKPDAVPPVRD